MRSEAVRQAVLARDDARCQICGDEFNVQVHHVQALGMGGSEARDVPENAVVVCGGCHAKIHDGHLTIARFGGDEFEVLDVERRRIPHERLWFHRRRLAEELEPIEARVQCLHNIDGDVARDIARLADGFKVLDPDAPSFAAFCAARGWDSHRAVRMARLYTRGQAEGVEWPAGMTAPEYHRMVKERKGEEERKFWHVVFRSEGEVRELMRRGCVRFVRASGDEVADMGCPAVKAGKLFRFRSDGERLTDFDGEVLA